MKRAHDDHPLREHPGEDRLVFAPSRALLAEELELVEIHRALTQHWRTNSAAESRPALEKLGLPSLDRGAFPEAPKDDAEVDAQFARLLAIAESSVIPDELLQAEFVSHALIDSATHDVPDVKQAIDKIDQVMQREATFVAQGDQRSDDKSSRNQLDFESALFPESDEQLVGDYHYTFCEEDDTY